MRSTSRKDIDERMDADEISHGRTRTYTDEEKRIGSPYFRVIP
jgi:hypothetical protein